MTLSRLPSDCRPSDDDDRLVKYYAIKGNLDSLMKHEILRSDIETLLPTVTSYPWTGSNDGHDDPAPTDPLDDGVWAG